MTYVAAQAAFKEFAKDVDRVEQLLDLTRVFRDFAGQEVESSGYAHDLWIAAQRIRTDLPIFSGSLLLYLCGRFEYFVRDLVSTIVDEMVDKAASYQDLPESLRKEYLDRTLSINQNPYKFNHTRATAAVLAAELASNLAETNDPGIDFRLDANTVTITEANMNSATLVELFKRVAIDKAWDTLGKQLPLKNYLGESTDQDCKKAAIARLDDVMKERNRIAHPTGSTVFPDAKTVQDIAQYFRVLAQVLVDLALAPR